jgi:hypothetical protein
MSIDMPTTTVHDENALAASLQGPLQSTDLWQEEKAAGAASHQQTSGRVKQRKKRLCCCIGREWPVGADLTFDKSRSHPLNVSLWVFVLLFTIQEAVDAKIGQSFWGTYGLGLGIVLTMAPMFAVNNRSRDIRCWRWIGLFYFAAYTWNFYAEIISLQELKAQRHCSVMCEVRTYWDIGLLAVFCISVLLFVIMVCSDEMEIRLHGTKEGGQEKRDERADATHTRNLLRNNRRKSRKRAGMSNPLMDQPLKEPSPPLPMRNCEGMKEAEYSDGIKEAEPNKKAAPTSIGALFMEVQQSIGGLYAAGEDDARVQGAILLATQIDKARKDAEQASKAAEPRRARDRAASKVAAVTEAFTGYSRLPSILLVSFYVTLVLVIGAFVGLHFAHKPVNKLAQGLIDDFGPADYDAQFRKVEVKFGELNSTLAAVVDAIPSIHAAIAVAAESAKAVCPSSDPSLQSLCGHVQELAALESRLPSVNKIVPLVREVQGQLQHYQQYISTAEAMLKSFSASLHRLHFHFPRAWHVANAVALATSICFIVRGILAFSEALQKMRQGNYFSEVHPSGQYHKWSPWFRVAKSQRYIGE